MMILLYAAVWRIKSINQSINMALSILIHTFYFSILLPFLSCIYCL